MKRILSLFRNRNRAPATITVIITAAVTAGILFWPCGPRKPDVIPLGDYSYTIEYVDYQVNRLMDKYDLPSVVVALIDDQDVVYKQAYGLANLETKRPATLDTVYKRLASGNMQSTMHDMVKFAQYIFQIGETNEKQVIGEDTLCYTNYWRVSQQFRFLCNLPSCRMITHVPEVEDIWIVFSVE